SRRNSTTAAALDAMTKLRPPGATIFTDSIGLARLRSSSPMPSSSPSASAVGESPEPQVLSRGKVAPSRRRTSLTPLLAKRSAAAAPPGPAPTTITSWVVMTAAYISTEPPRLFAVGVDVGHGGLRAGPELACERLAARRERRTRLASRLELGE